MDFKEYLRDAVLSEGATMAEKEAAYRHDLTSKSYDYLKACKAARNTKDPKVQDLALKHQSSHVRAEAEQNKWLHHSHVERLLSDGDYGTRSKNEVLNGLANNRGLTADHYANIASRSRATHFALAHNPSVPHEVLDKISNTHMKTHTKTASHVILRAIEFHPNVAHASPLRKKITSLLGSAGHLKTSEE